MALDKNAGWFPQWQEEYYNSLGIRKRDEGENRSSWVGNEQGRPGTDEYSATLYGQGEGTLDLPDVADPSQDWLNNYYQNKLTTYGSGTVEGLRGLVGRQFEGGVIEPWMLDEYSQVARLADQGDPAAQQRKQQLDLAFLDIMDPNRGYDNNFISRTLGTPLAPLALAGVGYGLGTFGAEAAGGAGGAAAAGGEVAAGGAMDMFGSAGVGSALGGEATMSAAELAALSGAGTGTAGVASGAGETFGATGNELYDLAGNPIVQGAGGFTTGAAAGAGAAGAAGAGAGAGAAASTPIQRLLGLDQNSADLLSILGPLGAGTLGYLGQRDQTDAYRDVANQYINIGEPYRGKLLESYQPGFDLMSQPGYGDALKRTADISAKSANVTYGNPYDAGAQGQIMSDVWNQSYLPALANYRGGLGQFGGLGINTAGAASTAGAGTEGSQYAPVAGTIGQLFKQSDPYEELARTMTQRYRLT